MSPAKRVASYLERDSSPIRCRDDHGDQLDLGSGEPWISSLGPLDDELREYLLAAVAKACRAALDAQHRETIPTEAEARKATRCLKPAVATLWKALGLREPSPREEASARPSLPYIDLYSRPMQLLLSKALPVERSADSLEGIAKAMVDLRVIVERLSELDALEAGLGRSRRRGNRKNAFREDWLFALFDAHQRVAISAGLPSPSIARDPRAKTYSGATLSFVKAVLEVVKHLIPELNTSDSAIYRAFRKWSACTQQPDHPEMILRTTLPGS